LPLSSLSRLSALCRPAQRITTTIIITIITIT